MGRKGSCSGAIFSPSPYLYIYYVACAYFTTFVAWILSLRDIRVSNFTANHLTKLLAVSEVSIVSINGEAPPVSLITPLNSIF